MIWGTIFLETSMLWVYMYVCMCIHTYIYMYVCMYVCTYVRTYVCMYVCVCVCMCIYVYNIRIHYIRTHYIFNMIYTCVGLLLMYIYIYMIISYGVSQVSEKMSFTILYRGFTGRKILTFRVH